jgi:4a-hydroxytetrahydrobiopterin dehydratase
MELNEMHCRHLPKASLPLVEGEVENYLKQLEAGWSVVENGTKLRREFPFEDFNSGVVFVNDIASIADAENHHPDIGLHYNKVEVEFSTHSLNGLTINDFIMASKVDVI